MLTYNFNDIDCPLYEYIYKRIKEDILSGTLKPNEKLPSKRTFARNNGVSSITIQNAYDQLIGEGYVYTVPKKGYYVAFIGDLAKTQRVANVSFNFKKPEDVRNFEIDLSRNQTDVNLFPFSVWAKLLRDVVAKKSGELMQTSPTGGIFELRAAIGEHLRSFRGMIVNPDQIVVGAGSEYLYSLLILLLGTDKKYCVENPGYKKIARIYQQHKIKCRFVDIDEKGISTVGLRHSGANIAHISPNHHFPTGVVMPANRRYDVLAWANESQERYIVEDDYDGEFRSNGRPIPTLFSIDACDKVIYMNTFSKSLAPTIRIAYMVLPERLANLFYQELSFYSCTVSNFEQYTLAEFITRGYFEKHINRTRLFYARRRRQIVEIVRKSNLKDICDILENDAGLHFLIKLNTNVPDETITERLQKEGIRLNALSEYYFTEKHSSKGVFIIDYSNLDPEKMTIACEKIYAATKE